jgi:2-oxoglutarate dehydrogenase E2 component (dihydrolipoamide succinyltransferase)
MHDRIELRLPDLGFTAAGLDDMPIQLCAWYAAVGDRVTEGESLAEILAGELVLELPAPASGYLVERRVEAGAPLAVGQVLAMIESGTSPRDAVPRGPVPRGTVSRG